MMFSDVLIAVLTYMTEQTNFLKLPIVVLLKTYFKFFNLTSVSLETLHKEDVNNLQGEA